MAPPGKSDIKVTASDALEFEPVIHEPPKRRWGLRLFVVLVLVAGGVLGWHYYGDRLQQLWSGADTGIPFIRAATTPVKVRPENPGGLEVPDRDKLVYDRIQGTAENRGPERLLPPPEQPLPRPAPAPAAASSAPSPPAPEKAVKQVPTPSPPLKPVARVPTAKDVATAERPAPPPPPPAPPTASKSSPLGLAAPQHPAPVESPKPEATVAAPAPPAPEKLPETLNVPEPPSPPREATTAATPASPPPATAAVPAAGMYLVQLAAARSQQGAETEWEKLREKNQDLLGNLRLSVTRADLGPARGIFYRLRAGPIADEAAARALCSQLTKRQIGCLVIKPGQ